MGVQSAGNWDRFKGGSTMMQKRNLVVINIQPLIDNFRLWNFSIGSVMQQSKIIDSCHLKLVK